jgi:hypothetical protein
VVLCGGRISAQRRYDTRTTQSEYTVQQAQEVVRSVVALFACYPPPSVVKLKQHMHAVQHQIASEQAHLVSPAAQPINRRVQAYQWLEQCRLPMVFF